MAWLVSATHVFSRQVVADHLGAAYIKPLASCPSPDLIRGLARASTSFLRASSEKGADGRDKPGHDAE